MSTELLSVVDSNLRCSVMSSCFEKMQGLDFLNSISESCPVWEEHKGIMASICRLALIVGKYNAMRAILTGEPILAAQLKTLGYDVYPTEKFEESVLKLAQTMSNRSFASLITAKKAVNASVEMSLAEGVNLERSIFYPLMATKGAAEGVTAFIEKRKPNFKGV